ETFGVTTWSARLAGAVPGVLACLVLARLGTLLAGPDVGLAAGAILALTPGFVRFASTLLLDPMMLLAALLALLAMARAWERGGRGLWRAGAWLGVAFLAKGALALIAVAYGALLLAGKHSPRYLMLLHPAVALWAALAVAPVLGRRVAPAVAMVAALAWLAILVWPHPFHPSGTGAAVVALAPELG